MRYKDIVTSIERKIYLLIPNISNPVPIPHHSRDRIVGSTLRCGRSNPGSNPGHGITGNFDKVENVGRER